MGDATQSKPFSEGSFYMFDTARKGVGDDPKNAGRPSLNC